MEPMAAILQRMRPSDNAPRKPIEGLLYSSIGLAHAGLELFNHCEDFLDCDSWEACASDGMRHSPLTSLAESQIINHPDERMDAILMGGFIWASV